MTIPATLSIASAAVSLMAALVALGISSAPGWRELRWFAACAACAGLCLGSNVWVSLDVDLPTRLVFARFALFFGGLHAAGWFVYMSAHDRRPLSRFDRAFVGCGLLVSCLTLVPGLVLRDEVLARPVPLFGVVYRDALPTRFGELAFLYHSTGLAVLLGRSIKGWRSGARDSGPHAIALGAVLVGATHDGIALTGITRTPYLMDVALVVLVLSVGATIVSRFLASARALEESSQRLAAAQEELVGRERMAALGELAAVVAHEVRNPLAVVFNALAGLRKVPEGSPDRERLLAIVQEEAERLRDMVSDLLDFAKPKAPLIAPADLAEVVHAAVDAAREEVHASADQVRVQAPESLALECDEKLVRQAVINLVTNALQADARRSPVEVAVETGDDGVVVAVTDDGDGVAEDLRDRVFTPFFTTRPSGTGLGLAVVQRCAEAHGGAISIDKAGARGARFTLRLPRR